MTTRDIVETFAELYGSDISPTLISQVTNSVLEKDLEWQSRPLDAVYPILYLDFIVVKIRKHKRVINKAIYVKSVGSEYSRSKRAVGGYRFTRMSEW